MAVFLAAIMALIWYRTTSATSGLCHVEVDPWGNIVPLKAWAYPSYVFVFTAIGAYLGGHLTNRVAVEKRPELAAGLGEGKFEDHRTVLVVKLLVAGFLLVVTVINVLEMLTLQAWVWPITYYVRCSADASPPLSLLGVAIFSFLTGRWLWVTR
jgi:hypothetical protein